MKLRTVLGIAVMAGAFAATASATVFQSWPFDRVVRESDGVVRGTIVRTWSAWDDSNETIFTYADVQVANWMNGSGKQTITVREVGGTVAGYTQEAIDFPVLRTGEDVVLFLTRWEDTGDYRIQAYSQGKLLVQRSAAGTEFLVRDVRTQGNQSPASELMGAAEMAGIPMDEFEMMLGASLRGIEEQSAR